MNNQNILQKTALQNCSSSKTAKSIYPDEIDTPWKRVEAITFDNPEKAAQIRVIRS